MRGALRGFVAALAALLLLHVVAASARGDGIESELRAQLAKERRAHALVVARLRSSLAHDRHVDDAIRLASIVYGVPLREARLVASCESRFRSYARNPSSGASGLFQFLPSTYRTTPFRDVSIFSPYANALAAGWLYSRSGWRPWECKP